MSKLQLWTLNDSGSLELDPNGGWVRLDDIERELLALLGWKISSPGIVLSPLESSKAEKEE